MNLLERIQVYRINRRYIQYEERELAKIPRIACDPTRLRTISAEEIRGIFSNPQTELDWAASAGALSSHCSIADGTTSAVNPGDRRALYYLVRGLRPRRILEIGTHVGASTAHIACALAREMNTLEAPALVSVDLEDVNAPDGPWKRLNVTHSPADMLNALGCHGKVQFIPDKSPGFLQNPMYRYDMIFLDGSHAASVVYQEIPLALAALNPNGIILLHDYYPNNKALWTADRRIVPGPWTAVRRFVAEGVPIQVHPLGALPWPTKLGSSVTSLAVLAKGADGSDYPPAD